MILREGLIYAKLSLPCIFVLSFMIKYSLVHPFASLFSSCNGLMYTVFSEVILFEFM